MAKAPGRSSAASAPSGQGATAGTGKGTGGAAAAAGATGSNSANNLPLAAKVAEVLFLLMEKRNEDLLRVPDEKGCRHTWLYSNGLWSLLADPTEWLDHRIEMTLREMKCSSKSKGHFIAEARRYIERSPNVRPKGSMAWDAHGKVPTRSGLIDPVTLKCEPFKKEHYATWLIDVDYDPAAKCPLWEEMLGDYFPTHSADEREQRVVLLQDFSGTMLIDQLSKTLKRALVPYGPSDTGKSTLMRVLWRMITVKPISVAFADVSGPRCASAVVAARTATAAECLAWLAAIRAVTASVPATMTATKLAPTTTRCRRLEAPRLAYTYARCSAVGSGCAPTLTLASQASAEANSLPRSRKLLSRPCDSQFSDFTSQCVCAFACSRSLSRAATIRSSAPSGSSSDSKEIQLRSRISACNASSGTLIRSTGRIRFPQSLRMLDLLRTEP